MPDMQPLNNHLSTTISLKCGCTRMPNPWSGVTLDTYLIFQNDHRVNVFPKDVIPFHNCPKLSVAQERKGLARFYIVKDPSIISK
jgi:hypothetical protein